MLVSNIMEQQSQKPTNNTTENFGAGDYLKITVLGFALTALWSSIHSLILPLRLLNFVPDAQKNTYLDLLILTGLVLALLVQPIAGAFSDSSSLRWGRRRPYILAGTVVLLVLLSGIVLFPSYAAIFAVYCMMQIASNIAQGPYQAFIPEMVPEGRRGRASGVKGLLSIIGGVVLIRVVAVLMNRYPDDNTGILFSLLILGSLVAITLLVTVFTVRETPYKGNFVSPFTSIKQSFSVNLKGKSQFILFLVASFLVFTGWNTLSAHALYYFNDVVHIDDPLIVTANLVIAMGIGMIIVVYFAGLLSDKIGRRPVVVGSGFIGALGVVVLFFSHNYWQVLLSGALLGMCAGAWLSSQWALAVDLVGKGEEAKYLGLANMSIAGAGVAARLIGPLIDTLNASQTNLGYQIMLLICLIYFIAGSIMLMRVKIPSR
jgi:Na+/melibiose symporter-like transporter